MGNWQVYVDGVLDETGVYPVALTRNYDGPAQLTLRSDARQRRLRVAGRAADRTHYRLRRRRSGDTGVFARQDRPIAGGGIGTIGRPVAGGRAGCSPRRSREVGRTVKGGGGNEGNYPATDRRGCKRRNRRE